MELSTVSTNGEVERYFDASEQQLASVYARALLDAAEATGAAAATVDELDSLVRDVTDKLPQLGVILASGLIPTAEKLGILRRSLEKHVSATVMNFLQVLAKHERLGLFRAVVHAARAEFNRRMGQIPVHVTTAVPLDEQFKTELVNKLRTRLGGEPVLHAVVDPKLIAGIVLRLGDTVYDGSVATRLAQVREQMVNRSIHEIQSRRDRFGLEK